MASRFFERMRQAVRCTADNLKGRLGDLFMGRREIDADLLEDLEATLLGADIGVQTTTEILERVRRGAERNQLADAEALGLLVREGLRDALSAATAPPPPAVSSRPRVVFLVGVNGVGKTTTLGKLANRLCREGQRVVVCAADTFRAAAVEQLAVWSERAGASMVGKGSGSDPGAVLFDALDRATQIDADTVLVDTAGRLHTKVNLMHELGKMTRIAARKVDGAPHETLLILDATTGQNGLAQAREFVRSAGATGLIVTKLDGTARGGVVVAIARELRLPIRYVGVGETIDDLIDFHVDDYVDSLLARRETP